MDVLWIVITALAGLIIGAVVVVLVMQNQSNSKVKAAQNELEAAKSQAQQIKETARVEAEARKKEGILAAKEEALKLKQEQEAAAQMRTKELRSLEGRIIQREESLDQRSATLDKRENQLHSLQGTLDKRAAELDEKIAAQEGELERIANLSREQAHDELLEAVKKDVVAQEAKIIRESERRAKLEADRAARNIISLAISRTAAEQTNEVTVTTVHIPSDDIKGRIIGREGRNIRTFEQISGVSILIDDTPETVVLSCYDGVRREIARVTLENLIADGRIHPARIEEMYQKAESLVETRVMEAGEQAAYDLGIHDLDPEIIRTLGALKYRLSYGQNVLAHSVQVAEFCGLMAAELGVDVATAKRAGLLHDLGKAISKERDRPHALVGAELADRAGERPEIVHAIQSHHSEIEPNTVYDFLVMGADAISAARPGARRESAEAYMKRLEQLEEISNAHEGVEKTYAMQAGREVHVMVEPKMVNDNEATVLAHEIAQEIESSMQYPGQVKVVVIRESRAVDIAK